MPAEAGDLATAAAEARQAVARVEQLLAQSPELPPLAAASTRVAAAAMEALRSLLLGSETAVPAVAAPSVSFSPDVISSEGEEPARGQRRPGSAEGPFSFGGPARHHAHPPSGRVPPTSASLAATRPELVSSLGVEAAAAAAAEATPDAAPAPSRAYGAAASSGSPSRPCSPEAPPPAGTASRKPKVITGGAAELQGALDELPPGAVALVHWRANWVAASLAADEDVARVGASRPFARAFRLDVEMTLENRALAFEKVVELPASRRVGVRPVPKRGARWPIVSVHVAPGLHPVGVCHGEDSLVDAVEIARGWQPEGEEESDGATEPEMSSEGAKAEGASEDGEGAAEPATTAVFATAAPTAPPPVPVSSPEPTRGPAGAHGYSAGGPPRRAIVGGAADFRDALKNSQPGPPVLVLWHRQSDEGGAGALAQASWAGALAARPLLMVAGDERHTANAQLSGALKIRALPALHAYRGLTRVGAWATGKEVSESNLEALGVTRWSEAGAGEALKVWERALAGGRDARGSGGSGRGKQGEEPEGGAGPRGDEAAGEGTSAASVAGGGHAPATLVARAAEKGSALAAEPSLADLAMAGGEGESEGNESQGAGGDGSEDGDESGDESGGGSDSGRIPPEDVAHFSVMGEVREAVGVERGESDDDLPGPSLVRPSADPYDPPPGKYARKAATKTLPDGRLVHFFPRMPCLRCGCPWWTSDAWNGRCLRCGWDCEEGGYDDESQPLPKWRKRWEAYVEEIKEGRTPKYGKGAAKK